jgi:hypothetical protein
MVDNGLKHGVSVLKYFFNTYIKENLNALLESVEKQN